MAAPANTPKPELPAALADAVAERMLAADPASRDAVLAALLREHPAHAAALKTLLADLTVAERMLAAGYPAPGADLPATIGGYRVLDRLGEGAFGTVFRCAQEQPIARQVAIKVFRPGVGDRTTLARFEAERQLLARLNHAAIAHVFDAGALPDGRPYFVMEYVDGVPISRYCERRQLDTVARLRLFLELCGGVEHAHVRGIIHRDLKPANILVVDTEAGPRPKIIDFGIAKALTGSAGKTELATDAGRVIGTPGYMSPEQMAGNAATVDARADVFSLGVMLYELLAGVLPWENGIETNDTEPPRPSSRVSSDSGSGRRRQLVAAIQGDLDWITLKALAREPERRYGSARELAQDLQRHLRGEPVSAGPPSTAYRLRRFVRRHRAAAWACGVAAAAMVMGLGGVLWSGRAAEAKVEAATTRLSAAEASAAASFGDAAQAVQRLLRRASDDQARSAPQGEPMRQALLQDALGFYDAFLRKQPGDAKLREDRCRTLITLSQVHWLLGQFERAASTATEAVGAAEGLLTEQPDSVARAGLAGEAHRKQGRAVTRVDAAGARAEFELATARLRGCAAHAPQDFGLSFAAALRELGTARALADGDRECVAPFQESVRVLERLREREPDSPMVRHDLLRARIGVGEILLFTNDQLEAAEQAVLSACDCLDPSRDDEPEAASNIHDLLGRIAEAQGNHAKAIGYLQKAIASGERWQERHPSRLLPREMLARSYRALGKAHNGLAAWDAASQAFRKAIAIAAAMARDFPEDPSQRTDLVELRREYADLLWERLRRSDLMEAETCVRTALAEQDHLPRPAGSQTRPRVERWRLLVSLARILDSSGGADTLALWQEACAEESAGDDVPELHAEAWIGLARSHLRAGRQDATEAALAHARKLVRASAANGRKPALQVARLTAELAAARGDSAGAAAAADRMVAADSTWLGKRLAGEALFAAWEAARSAPGMDAAVANGYRDRATELFGAVVDELREPVAGKPADAAVVVPFGQASIRLAQLRFARGEPDPARTHLEAALPALAVVCQEAHCDAWDAAVVRAGQALLAKINR